MNYLGFTFDGQNVSLRDKTVSKHYYKLYRKLKTITKNNAVTEKGRRISCANVYLKYSIKGSSLGDGNFITYVKRAERIFSNEKAVARIRKVQSQSLFPHRQLPRYKSFLYTDIYENHPFYRIATSPGVKPGCRMLANRFPLR